MEIGKVIDIQVKTYILDGKESAPEKVYSIELEKAPNSTKEAKVIELSKAKLIEKMLANDLYLTNLYITNETLDGHLDIVDCAPRINDRLINYFNTLTIINDSLLDVFSITYDITGNLLRLDINTSTISEIAHTQGINLVSNLVLPPVHEIIPYAFSTCVYIQTVVIGDELERIGKAAFVDTQSLEKVFIGKGLKYIDAHVFCSSSIKELTITSDDFVLESEVFVGSNIQTINGLENASYIGKNALGNGPKAVTLGDCDILTQDLINTEVLTIKGDVNIIGELTLHNCLVVAPKQVYEDIKHKIKGKHSVSYIKEG